MQVILMSSLAYRKQEWTQKLDISDGSRILFDFIVTLSRGRGFAWPSMSWMQEVTGKSARTIQRYLKELVEAGLIAIGTIITETTTRRGFAILPHPALIEWIRKTTARLKRAVQVVLKDFAGIFIPSKMAGKTTKVTPPSNYKEGSEVSITPPAPQGAIAAAAAKERQHEQPTQTNPPPQPEGQNFYLDSTQPDGTDPGDGQVSGRPGSKERNISGSPDGRSPKEAAHLSETPWRAALDVLQQTIPKQDFELWIRPIHAKSTAAGLQLDCPDRYSMGHVQDRYGDAIRSALQNTGVTDFFFSFGEQERALQKEKEEVAEAQQEIHWRELSTLSLEEQFAVLVSAYPRKTSGNWFAWQSFRRLARRGELPDIGRLLRLLKTHKQSEDWTRDAGRWIPGLSRWLNNKPWWDFGCKERGKKSGEVTLW